MFMQNGKIGQSVPENCRTVLLSKYCFHPIDTPPPVPYYVVELKIVPMDATYRDTTLACIAVTAGATTGVGTITLLTKSLNGVTPFDLAATTRNRHRTFSSFPLGDGSETMSMKNTHVCGFSQSSILRATAFKM